jgi:hypothetical protein
VRLQIGRVDHDRLVLGPLGGQADHDPGEDPIVAPPLPSVIKGLRRTIFLRRIAPAQTIAIDEDYAAKNATIIDARLTVALGKERLQALHLRVRQPVKIAHRSGLLAEPESRQMPEINGSGA